MNNYVDIKSSKETNPLYGDIHARLTHNNDQFDQFSNQGNTVNSDSMLKSESSIPKDTSINVDNVHKDVKMNFKTQRSVSVDPKSQRDDADRKLGLCNARALFFLCLWYLFSAFTLFLNKYILSTLKGEPTLLGAMQMMMTTVCGFIQMYLPLGMYTPTQREGKPENFWKNMILVGTMRFLTVILGLEALKFVAVSFTETVKSSAPIFTVLISRVLIGEETGLYTGLSLIPIMGGLALCTAYELSFNIKGLMAALATNLTECFQNVYSKLLISGEKHKYTPAELQFYTSLSSMVIQLPILSLMIDLPLARKTFDVTMIAVLIANGIFFHFQSITAYVLMDYISPVTHSVANTVKRAFLIWFSVILFGNPITILSGLGTITVTVGVLAYTKAREYDQTKREHKEHYAITMQSDGTKII